MTGTVVLRRHGAVVVNEAVANRCGTRRTVTVRTAELDTVPAWLTRGAAVSAVLTGSVLRIAPGGPLAWTSLGNNAKASGVLSLMMPVQPGEPERPAGQMQVKYTFDADGLDIVLPILMRTLVPPAGMPAGPHLVKRGAFARSAQFRTAATDGSVRFSWAGGR